MTAGGRRASADDAASRGASLLHNMSAPPSMPVRHAGRRAGGALGIEGLSDEAIAGLRSDPEAWLGQLVGGAARRVSRADIVRALDERLAASGLPGFAIVCHGAGISGIRTAHFRAGVSDDPLLAAAVFARCSSHVFLARLPPRLERIHEFADIGVMLSFPDPLGAPAPSIASVSEVTP